MKNIDRKLSGIIFISGLVIVFAGILLNQWTIAFFFSSDGELSTPNIRAIAIIDIMSVALGIIFIALYDKNHKITAFLLGVVISVLFLIFTEALFFIINRVRDSKIKTIMSDNLIMQDTVMGYKFHPDIRITSEKWFKKQLVYRVTYSIDSLGRRITPVQEIEKRDSFLLFFGCSSTFGHGLNDDQTLPFFTTEQMAHYFPYNYGVEGYGTQEVLLKIQDKHIRNEIKQRHGIGLYIFTDNHIYRAIGSMEVYNMWGQNMPYYYLDGKQLVHRGNFTTGRPVLSTFYWLLGKSQMLRCFNVNFPLNITGKHITLVQNIIKEINNSFYSKFPGSQFYIVFYPGTEQGLAVIPYLKQNGIKYLDYSKLFNPLDKRYKLNGDVHSSDEANSALAKKIAADLMNHR